MPQETAAGFHHPTVNYIWPTRKGIHPTKMFGFSMCRQIHMRKLTYQLNTQTLYRNCCSGWHSTTALLCHQFIHTVTLIVTPSYTMVFGDLGCESRNSILHPRCLTHTYLDVYLLQENFCLPIIYHSVIKALIIYNYISVIKALSIYNYISLWVVESSGIFTECLLLVARWLCQWFSVCCWAVPHPLWYVDSS